MLTSHKPFREDHLISVSTYTPNDHTHKYTTPPRPPTQVLDSCSDSPGPNSRSWQHLFPRSLSFLPNPPASSVLSRSAWLRPRSKQYPLSEGGFGESKGLPVSVSQGSGHPTSCRMKRTQSSRGTTHSSGGALHAAVMPNL